MNANHVGHDEMKQCESTLVQPDQPIEAACDRRVQQSLHQDARMEYALANKALTALLRSSTKGSSP